MQKIGLLGFLIVFLSCSSQVDIELLANGEALVNAKSSVEDFFLEYWKDLRELDSSLPESPIDSEAIQQNIRLKSDVQLLENRTRGLTNTTLLRLRNWTKFLTEEFKNKPGVVINATNLDIPVTINLFFATGVEPFSQMINPELSVAEIERELSAALQEYSRNPLDSVRKSSISLTIKAPRPLRSTNGSRLADGRSATWTFTLAQIIKGDRRISLSW